MSKNIEDYIQRIAKKLIASNYSEDKIKDICDNIRCIQKSKNDKNNSLEFTNWRNIIRNNPNEFKDVQSNDIKYFFIDGRTCAVVVRLNNNLYNVAFSFIHMDDLCSISKEINPVMKKHVLWNYVHNNYRYDNIKATSSINALTLAYNNNINNFPRRKNRCKITPYLSTICYYDFNDEYTTECVALDKNPYININNEYKKLKQTLLTSVESFDNVRFYLEFESMNIMVIRNKDNTHTVTFSFISDCDRALLLNVSDSDVIKICKKHTIENYLNNRYTYKVTDARNSISAAVRAYNLYRNKFPGKTRKYMKLKVDIHAKMYNFDVKEYIAQLKR